jgi:hypothetical protein
MSLLLKAGADAKARNKRGESPLHFAKNVDAAAMLVDAKADVNAVATMVAPHVIVRGNRPQVLSYLIAAGANVHAKDKQDRLRCTRCSNRIRIDVDVTY